MRREVNFFQILSKNLREKEVNIFLTLPNNPTYPAWEYELIETETKGNNRTLRIQFRGAFKDLSRDVQISEMERLKNAMTSTVCTFQNIESYAVKFTSEKFPLREKGSLPHVHLECLFFLRFVE